MRFRIYGSRKRNPVCARRANAGALRSPGRRAAVAAPSRLPSAGAAGPAQRRPLSYFLTAIAGVLAVVMPLASSGQILSDAQLRARFVLNFVRFTEWPPHTFAAPDAPLNLCVLGAGDTIYGSLAALQGAIAAGHRIEVRNGVTPELTADCHLLFVPDEELGRLPLARDVIGKRAVLIVGESVAALDSGAMIALRTVDRRLGFIVRMAAARSGSLNFSPQMLHAAAGVLP